MSTLKNPKVSTLQQAFTCVVDILLHLNFYVTFPVSLFLRKKLLQHTTGIIQKQYMVFRRFLTELFAKWSWRHIRLLEDDSDVIHIYFLENGRYISCICFEGTRDVMQISKVCQFYTELSTVPRDDASIPSWLRTRETINKTIQI